MTSVEQPKISKVALLDAWNQVLEPTPVDNLEPKAPDPQDTPELPLEPSLTPTEPEHDWKKRYDSIRRLDGERLKKISDLEDRLKELESKPDLSKLASEEELEEFRKVSPEAYAVLETIAVKKVSESNKEYKERLEALSKEQQKLAADKVMLEVSKVHPDAFDIRDEMLAFHDAKTAGVDYDSKFVSWFEGQTKGIRSLIESGDPQDIIEGLNFYKKSKGTQDKAKKKEAADSATSMTSASKGKPLAESGRTWLESEIAMLKGRELSFYLKDIEQAQREGRIVLDISGRR